MSVIWNKVWADLWNHKVRTLLAVLSIAAGVFALGAILGMIDQLIPNLNRVHASVQPANIIMILQNRINQDTADRFKNIKGVTGLEVLNELPIRYRLRPDQAWQPGMLTMRADYEDQKFNLLQLKEGEWPQRNNLGLDMRAFDHLGLKFGDRVILELDGSDRALAITGKIRHHFITSPDFGSDAHFFVEAKGLERFGIPAGEFNQLLVRIEPYSEDFAQQVASEIKERLGKEGVGVDITYYSKPNEHWAKRFFDGLNLILQLLAGVSLFMSVLLVYNTLSALINEQTNQIGIMKAVGGRTHVIVKVYLAGVLAYGLLALLVSLPLGGWAAFHAARYFLGIFNIHHNTFQFSSQVMLIQVATAVGVPLVVAFIPIFRGASISVREAIASYGLGSNFGASHLDRLVERLGRRFLSAPNAMALSNMFRRKGRLSLTQLVLVTAGALFLMVMTLSNSITLTVNNELGRRNYQALLIFEDNLRINRIVRMAELLPGVEKAEGRFSQSVSLLKSGQRTKEAGVGTRLIGIPDGSDMYRPLIVAGRWLQPGDNQVIVINAESAAENNIRLGEMVTLDLGHLGHHQWQVVGWYRTLAVVPASDTIYAPQAAIFSTTPRYNTGRELLVRTRSQDAASTQAVIIQLREIFEEHHWEIDDIQTIHEDRRFFDNFFAQYIPMLMALAVIMAIVGGIGLMGSLFISVAERTKEIGVLRAIGAKTPLIMGMLILEGVLQGVISWLVAVPLSFVLGQPLAVLMGKAMFDIALDYQYNLGAMLTWLLTVVVIAILASVMPARTATTISVRESLTYA